MIHVSGPGEPQGSYPGITVVNTTSRGDGWGRTLSPFLLGPVPLYEGAVVSHARNVENAWQYSKVYKHHDNGGRPTTEYFMWARDGWDSARANRYPMGKGAIPVYSWWAGHALSYIEARREIYVRLYASAVLSSSAWPKLVQLYKERGTLVLWDFDGYDHHRLGRSLREVLHDTTRKMGHAFVLAMLLERLIPTASDPSPVG